MQPENVRNGCKAIKVEDMILLSDTVHVAWEWNWDNGEDSEDEAPDNPETEDDVNPYLASDSEGSDMFDFTHTQLTHTVTFKCIGTTHDHSAQDTLAKVVQLNKENNEVSVDIFPEPDNQYDSKAICFKCQIGGEWKRIGYIVREALDHVHEALTEQKIINVKFSWVKYLAVWSKSGPGFYAGVNISKNGEWHPSVVKCSSTR